MFNWLKNLFAGGLEGDRSPGWPKARAEHLKWEPVCQWCGGRDNLEVHHELPVHFPGGKERELDQENMITLCRPDHLEIGHLGDWKAMNPIVRQDCGVHQAKRIQRVYPPPHGVLP